MEVVTKATALTVALICLGIGMLILVVVELIRPPLSEVDWAAEDSPRFEANWFAPRTFRLFEGAQNEAKGIDLKLLETKQLFAGPLLPPEPVSKPKPVVEKKPKPPPPPATRKVEVCYRGVSQNSQGAVFIYLELEGKMRVLPLGSEVAEAWSIAEANVNRLSLTQGDAQRVDLPLNRKKSLEVPIR